MAQPMKLCFTQDVTAVSAVKRETLGALRVLADGRAFRYARAGAGGLSAGSLALAPLADPLLVNVAAPVAQAGDRVLILTSPTAVTENALEDGYLQVNDGDARGMQRRILANAACGAGESLTLTLADPLDQALTASSRISLVPSPWAGVVASDSPENAPAGVAPVAAAAGRHLWLQSAGPGLCLCQGAPAVGTMLTPGTAAGALAAMNPVLDVDRPVAAVTMACAGVDGQIKPVFLKID